MKINVRITLYESVVQLRFYGAPEEAIPFPSCIRFRYDEWMFLLDHEPTDLSYLRNSHEAIPNRHSTGLTFLMEGYKLLIDWAHTKDDVSGPL